ncbi:hypothetical protein [Aestuariicoccus sp. MJ-SS9]|uniref:hypothetical protein n=1 Tax=Aestuariicoccus sp. MJ-SS9 TaxID=3079855 RepID=UPI00290607F1|nr:hypothetical protein [Aestuariicoccus sp. MJ-SS9]MDU8912691.1 hypothetical protein [Aestuariicoccus sp. MJ-SS9]
MTHLMQNWRNRIAKRAAFSDTLHELQSLPLNVKLDLDIAGIESKVAARAVYG